MSNTVMEEMQKKQAAYAAERRAQANTAAADIARVYDAVITDAEKHYASSAAETEAVYRAVYDANAVSEFVARKHAEEALRKWNPASSGLSGTEQTAISLARGRADTETTRRKQAAVDSLMRELDALRAQAEQQKAAEQAAIHANADADIASYNASMHAAYAAMPQSAATGRMGNMRIISCRCCLMPSEAVRFRMDGRQRSP